MRDIHLLVISQGTSNIGFGCGIRSAIVGQSSVCNGKCSEAQSDTLDSKMSPVALQSLADRLLSDLKANG